jgi:hypothetical protein
MPANLTPQYLAAEDEYRQASTLEEKLEALKKMLALLPKHKGTDKLQASIRAKISKTKAALESEKKKGRRGPRIRITRDGAGQVVLIGAPNTGKSQILAALTSAKPVVAPYPFSTHAPQPGMMPWENVQVQLIDTPPITPEYMESYLPGMVRAADAALLVMDMSIDEGIEQAERLVQRLDDAKLRLTSHPSEAADEEDEHLRLLADAAEVKCIIAANKMDAPEAELRLELATEELGDRFELLPVSATTGQGMDRLRDRLYEILDVIRVYTKKPGKPPEWDQPYTCPRNSRVIDLARLVHREIAESFKFARIWGTGVYDGQTVGRDHVLHDGDLVELHT